MPGRGDYLHQSLYNQPYFPAVSYRSHLSVFRSECVFGERQIIRPNFNGCKTEISIPEWLTDGVARRERFHSKSRHKFIIWTYHIDFILISKLIMAF
jgi:hypothetical protein